jgi:hypothetical protein
MNKWYFYYVVGKLMVTNKWRRLSPCTRSAIVAGITAGTVGGTGLLVNYWIL